MSTVFTPERIKELLRDRNITAVARATGLGYHTIRNIYKDTTKEPKLSTIQALTDYLRGAGYGDK